MHPSYRHERKLQVLVAETYHSVLLYNVASQARRIFLSASTHVLVSWTSEKYVHLVTFAHISHPPPRFLQSRVPRSYENNLYVHDL